MEKYIDSIMQLRQELSLELSDSYKSETPVSASFYAKEEKLNRLYNNLRGYCRRHSVMFPL